MNENKWIDNPWITIIECVGANSRDGKMRWILITKTTMVVNFNLQNSHWLTCPYRRRNLSGKLQKLASGKSSSCWLSFSAERCGNTKATKCVSFSFVLVYWFPTPSKKVWTLQSVGDTHILVFYRRDSRKFRQKTCIENREGFAVHSSTWSSGANGKCGWLAISTHVKEYDIFSRVLLRLFSEPQIPV